MPYRKMFLDARKSTFLQAVELRMNMTPSEKKLWSYLRTKPHGHKFRRQHPISKYIADFYCHSLSLIIEVDGGVHQQHDVKEQDKVRQEFLESKGIYFLRFTDKQVEEELDTVIATIEQYISEHS